MISHTSRRTDGIAKIDGFVIFVSDAKRGQQARIKVTQVTNRYGTGTMVEGSSPAMGGSQQQEQQTSGSAAQQESTEGQA